MKFLIGAGEAVQQKAIIIKQEAEHGFIEKLILQIIKRLDDTQIFALLMVALIFVGVIIILSGAALVAVGYLQHAHVGRLLNPRGEARRPRWPVTITVTAFLGALGLSVLIIVST